MVFFIFSGSKDAKIWSKNRKIRAFRRSHQIDPLKIDGFATNPSKSARLPEARIFVMGKNRPVRTAPERSGPVPNGPDRSRTVSSFLASPRNGALPNYFLRTEPNQKEKLNGQNCQKGSILREREREREKFSASEKSDF